MNAAVIYNVLHVFLLCKAVKYTVEADMERRRSPRVRFLDNNDDTYTGLLSLPSTKSKCHSLKLIVVVRSQFKYAILCVFMY